MTTFRLANDLAAVMVPIGMVGAGLAVICAIVAGVAIMRGAGGLSGGAVGVWIPFALMSFTASFANQWLPLIVSGAALVAMLAIGGVVRAIVNAAEPGRHTRPAVIATSKAAPVTGAVAVVSAS
ncbi:hypothetical protein [Microbacterium oxydans]|uniref:Uncharacterized protein n=2 Tax=Microbacterium oxydans TaxID=82380 RepID=A0A0F0LFG2_9MICO|nr:hypothetical protein [Microbacterium oxydans]KJL30261.1 hypothetical protein RS83_01011 [Microbacterium oxydans]